MREVNRHSCFKYNFIILTVLIFIELFLFQGELKGTKIPRHTHNKEYEITKKHLNRQKLFDKKYLEHKLYYIQVNKKLPITYL